MKMLTAYVSPSGFETILKQSRMISYIGTNLTKTLMKFSKQTIDIYFSNSKSIFHATIPLESDLGTDTMYVLADFAKFLSAAKKVAQSGNGVALTITESPATMRLQARNLPDKIALSIQVVQETDAEIADILNFYQRHIDQKTFENQPQVLLTDELYSFIRTTTTFMTPTNKNNSIALTKDALLYSDRTIVLTMLASVVKDLSVDQITLHRFLMGFLDFLSGIEPPTATVSVTKISSLLKWESSNPELADWWGIFMIDPCILAIPSDADVASITPEATEEQKITLVPSTLLSSIEFFSGLFEASSWKPITFIWDGTAGSEKVKLTYLHPSTEVEKDLPIHASNGNLAAVSTSASFTLISDAVRSVVSAMSDDGVTILSFNAKDTDEAHGQGVYMEHTDSSGNLKYKVAFAKLTEA